MHIDKRTQAMRVRLTRNASLLLMSVYHLMPIFISIHVVVCTLTHTTLQEDAGANMSEKVDQMMQLGVNRLIVNMNTLRSYFTNANPRYASTMLSYSVSTILTIHHLLTQCDTSSSNTRPHICV